MAKGPDLQNKGQVGSNWSRPTRVQAAPRVHWNHLLHFWGPKIKKIEDSGGSEESNIIPKVLFLGDSQIR